MCKHIPTEREKELQAKAIMREGTWDGNTNGSQGVFQSADVLAPHFESTKQQTVAMLDLGL